MSVVSTALKPIADNWEWQHDGLCVDQDPEMFFLEPNMRGKQKRTKEVNAKAVCQECPVKMRCLEHALSVPEIYGVWGGMTEEERLVLAQKRGITYGYIRV
jgi:WhiB family redox-sensing transcriptional regulator